MKRIQIQIALIWLIGMVLISIPNVKGECWTSNAKRVYISTESPSNQTTIYGTSVTIKYGITDIGDALNPISQECIQNFTVYNPSNTLIYSATNKTNIEIGSLSYTYVIPNTTISDDLLVFRFYLTYNYTTNTSVIRNYTLSLIYIYGGLTEPSNGISSYTVYVIIGLTVLFAGVFIYFIARSNKRKEDEIPDYCNAIDPMTMRPYLFTDMACREKYLKKKGRLPEEVIHQPQVIQQPVYIPPPIQFTPIQNVTPQNIEPQLQPSTTQFIPPPLPPVKPKKRTIEEI